MTAREIVATRMAHRPTPVTPYTLDVEPLLQRRLDQYYGPGWYDRMLTRYISCHLWVDTVQMAPKDELYSVDGYGALWDMSKKPWHLTRPPLSEPTLNGYDFPTPEKFVAPIKANLPSAVAPSRADTDKFRIISMGWGIFEHSWRLRGFENALSDMILEPEFYAELCNRITDLYIEMLRACADFPAEAYLFGDDWGEQRGLIMGAALWRKFLKPCWARIYAEVHRQGKLVMQHSCGSIAEVYPDLIEIGMDCHESAQPEARNMGPKRTRDLYGDKITLWGALGSQSVLHFGTPTQIRDEIYRLRDLYLECGGLILAPAKPLVDEMPLDMACAVIETFATLND